MKQTLITLGLAALLGGCASMYDVKDEAPVRTANNSPAAEMTTDAEIEPSKEAPFSKMLHSLTSETSLLVVYSAHPLTYWDVRATATVVEGSMPETFARMGTPSQTYTCQGTMNKNNHFILSHCDKEVPSEVREKLEMKVLL